MIFLLPIGRGRGAISSLVAEVGNMIFLTRMTLWAFRWLGPPLRIFVSIRSIFGMTYARSSNISDHVFPSCFSSVRIDLSADDEAVALALVECPARPYAELIKSSIPSPSSSKSTRSGALRPSAAHPTRGEVLAQLVTLSQKPRSVKWKTPGSAEKDLPVLAKAPKLGASLISSV